MKPVRVCISLLLIIALLMPFSAAQDNKYSYITIEEVDIQLAGSTASISIDYEIDSIVSLLVLLLGKGDLKNKIDYILNFEDAKFNDLGMEHATVVVEGASYDYLDGTFWFPTHQFNAEIPKLKVSSPQATRIYNNTKTFPQGMGYFDIPGSGGAVQSPETVTTATQNPFGLPEVSNSTVF